MPTQPDIQDGDDAAATIYCALRLLMDHPPRERGARASVACAIHHLTVALCEIARARVYAQAGALAIGEPLPASTIRIEGSVS